MNIRFIDAPPFLPEHADVVLHTGFGGSCEGAGLIATPRGGHRVVYVLDAPTSHEASQRAQRLKGMMGEPFVEFVRPYKVYTISRGGKIRKDAIEMVWNDAEMANRVCGPGYYEMVMRPDVEVEILALARVLHAAAVQSPAPPVERNTGAQGGE